MDGWLSAVQSVSLSNRSQAALFGISIGTSDHFGRSLLTKFDVRCQGETGVQNMRGLV